MNRIGYIILIVIIVVMGYFLLQEGCGKNNNDVTTTYTSQQQDSIRLALTEQVINAVMDSCNCKKTKKPATPSAPKPRQTETVDIPPTTYSTPDPTPTTTTPSRIFSDAYYEKKSTDVIFCVNYNQRQDGHLPHLALDRGDDLEAFDNGIQGYNFKVSPDQLKDSYQGEFGLTKNGTFFITKNLIDNYNIFGEDAVIYIKTTVTGWRFVKMSLNNGYYTYSK